MKLSLCKIVKKFSDTVFTAIKKSSNVHMHMESWQ